MQSRTTPPAAGFTLVELMIVVVIASILLAIAVPSYMTQVRESRRTEAKTALLDLAGRGKLLQHQRRVLHQPGGAPRL